MYRGRRPMGMGFFFAMGHSSVVVFPALLIFGGAGQSAKVPSRTSPGLGDSCRSSSPLLPASGRAGLNTSVLRSLVTLWGEARAGNLDYALVDQKLIARLHSSKGRFMISSSWHSYPVNDGKNRREVPTLCNAAKDGPNGEQPGRLPEGPRAWSPRAQRSRPLEPCPVSIGK